MVTALVVMGVTLVLLGFLMRLTYVLPMKQAYSPLITVTATILIVLYFVGVALLAITLLG